MNIIGLKYFITVAEGKSISKAAEELYITQPALSRHLQRLEEELGAKLFERERGKMTCQLTKAGKLCLLDARQIVHHADNMFVAVQTYIHGEEGELDIGYSGSEGFWLYEFVSQMKNHYPKIKINAQNLFIAELEKGLLDGNLDIAYLLLSRSASRISSLQYLEMERGRMKVLVSKHHHFAGREYVWFHELAAENFISWKREIYPDFFDWFCELCEQNSFSPKVVCYGDTEMLFSAIYAGEGFYPYNSVHQLHVDLQSFTLVNIRMDDGAFLQGPALALAWNRQNSNPCLNTAIKLAKKIHRGN